MNDITALPPVTPEMLAFLKLSALNLAEGEMMSFEPAVLRALVEALEKAQSANTAQDDHINQQQDQIDTLEKRNAELGREVIHLQCLKTVNAARQEAESEFHRGYSCGHKDASLESRTVTVKLPDPLMPAQHNSGELFMTPDNVIHGGYLNRDDVLRILAAAGIQVIEGEQKNG